MADSSTTLRNSRESSLSIVIFLRSFGGDRHEKTVQSLPVVHVWIGGRSATAGACLSGKTQSMYRPAGAYGFRVSLIDHSNPCSCGRSAPTGASTRNSHRARTDLNGICSSTLRVRRPWHTIWPSSRSHGYCVCLDFFSHPQRSQSRREACSPEPFGQLISSTSWWWAMGWPKVSAFQGIFLTGIQAKPRIRPVAPAATLRISSLLQSEHRNLKSFPSSPSRFVSGTRTPHH